MWTKTKFTTIKFYSFYWRCISKCEPKQNSQPLKQHNINGVLIWKWYYTNHNILSQQLWNLLSLTLLIARWLSSYQTMLSYFLLIPIFWVLESYIFKNSAVLLQVPPQKEAYKPIQVNLSWKYDSPQYFLSYKPNFSSLHWSWKYPNW